MKKIYLDELWHGGDYNPDQWLDQPEILEQDLQLMKESFSNAFSVGMFSWTSLEPEDGVYDFSWLDDVMNGLHSIGAKVALATPSAARPAWLAQKYPEVLRVTKNRQKNLYGERHNHCLSSPIYRKKVKEINKLLAERYKDHPALAMWHISNEYGGECHCDLCQESFRIWLKNKYGSLERLNKAWWNKFWSHEITDWSQVESPSQLGDNTLHGKNLDWRRFVSDQTIDFYLDEISVIRDMTPEIPITTNFMADTYEMIPFQGIDYAKFAKELDLITWDAYPAWHNDWESTSKLASRVAFINDLYRSLKQEPFLLLESTPSGVNWHDFNKTKRPGMHLLSSMQMIAHGSNSIMYFQWRKSKGASEKFHGAVIEHNHDKNNRVFQDVKKVGKTLYEMKEIANTFRTSEVAVVYDWDNSWIIEDVQGYGLSTKRYSQTVQDHHRAIWNLNIPTDVITVDKDLEDYKLVIIPMMYMMSEPYIDKIEKYIKNGGHVVATYISCVANEDDLVYTGPWKLKDVFGIDILETDTLYPKQENAMLYKDEKYVIKDYCTIINNIGADELAYYTQDYYKGTPVITHNRYGEGTATYIGARLDDEFHEEFYKDLLERININQDSMIQSEHGVSVQTREDSEYKFHFVMNFTEECKKIYIKNELVDFFSNEISPKEIKLKPYESRVLKENK